MESIKDISSLLERRFFANHMVPCGALWLALISLFVGHSLGFEKALSLWARQPASTQLALVALLVVAVVLTASFQAALTIDILKLLEGYNWPRPLKWLCERKRAWHQNLFKHLDDNTKYYRYPANMADDAMPTRFGNILKAGERHAFERYGLDSVLVWSRLYNLLPDRTVENLDAARSSMELAIRVSVLAFLFALFAGVYLVIIRSNWMEFLACFWGGIALSRMAYVSSLPPAIAYSEQIKAAFDEFRNDLLIKMRIPLPANLKNELETWTHVNQLLMKNAVESCKFRFGKAEDRRATSEL